LHSAIRRRSSCSARTPPSKMLPFPRDCRRVARKRKNVSQSHPESEKLGRIQRLVSNTRPYWECLHTPRRRSVMTDLATLLWRHEEGQDIAEYAVMLAVI